MRKADAIVSEALISQSMPEVAAAVRKKRGVIVERWNRMVRDLLPDADPLTKEQVEDSIPEVLEQMARALEARGMPAVEELAEVTKKHGKERFHDSYNVKELIVEYRLLRRILVEEVDGIMRRPMRVAEWLAIDTAVDLALEQAVLSFLEFQRGQLRSAAESEAKYLAFLAHEMRGGLNSVLLTMEWVEQSLYAREDLVEEKEGLGIARKAAMETVASLEQLLQAERFRQHRVAANYAELKLGEVIGGVVEQGRALAERKGLSILTQVPENARVRTDAGLLGLIVQNLLRNAIKYSNKGVVTVDAVPYELGGWIVRVTDEGPGIAPELLSHLFQTFERGSQGEGTGLGLYIASQAAATIGARLEVESAVNGGSTFKVFLPTGINARGRD